MSETAIAAMAAKLAAVPDGGGGLWPQNVPVVAAFLSIDTQWRTASVGGGMAPARLLFLGLDYQSAIAGIAAAGLTLTPEIWDGVRIIEAEARAVLNQAGG